MKNTGTCPKCESKEIVRIPGSYNWRLASSIRIGFMGIDGILITRFVCAKCGFNEEWIEDLRDLATLSEMHRMVSAENPDSD